MFTEIKQKVRIRGIYSTTLTKLFLDNNWEITQPSEKIKKKFELNENWKPFSVDIWDRKGKNGIMIQGKTEKAIKTLKNLPDIVIKEKPYEIGGIYNGTIINRDNEKIRVDIGPSIGEITEEEIEGQRKEIKVKVDEVQNGLKLSKEISIPGPYCVLIPNKGVKVSRKIKNNKLREKLIDLGRDINTDDWGIIWRSSAAKANEKTLQDSVEKLKRKKQRLDEFNPAPSKIIEGREITEIIFTEESKRILDEIRGKVLPTVKGHHKIKSAEKDLSFGVNVAEKILENEVTEKPVEKGLKQALIEKFSKVGDRFYLEHEKLDNNYTRIGPGRIINFDDSEIEKLKITLKRKMKGDKYDGLNIPIKDGDVAITEIEEGERSYKHSYYSKNGRLKGEYYNINTPIEIYSNHARYVDLGVDVIKWPNGNKKIIDKEILSENWNKGKISEKTYNKAFKKAEEIYKSI